MSEIHYITKNNKVIEIRKMVGNKYLIEYCDKSHKYVLKEEFDTTPIGCERIIENI